jgi:hypothetical protein
VEGKQFSFHKEALTFRGHTAYKSLAIPVIGVKKMLPNATHCWQPLCGSFGKFKGLTARPNWGTFGSKGLVEASVYTMQLPSVLISIQMATVQSTNHRLATLIFVFCNNCKYHTNPLFGCNLWQFET